MKVEQLTGPIAYHGEGPVWSPKWGGLRWVDMLAGDVLSLAEDGSVKRRHVDTVAAAIRPRRSGGAVIGGERQFLLEEPDGTIRKLDQLWSDTGGCADERGRLRPKWAVLLRLRGVRPIRRCGQAMSARRQSDGSHGADSGHRLQRIGLEPRWLAGLLQRHGNLSVSVFDYSPDAGLTNRRTFVEVADQGRPDGLTVDSEGAVWTAISNRGVVHRYTPTGVLDDVVDVRAQKVTSCTFGGDQLDELFITTSQEHVDTDSDPLAGCLFRAHVGVRGLSVREFAG